MKRTPALLIFIAIYKKMGGVNPKIDPDDTELGQWIRYAQTATDLCDPEIEGEAGLYRLGAEFSLVAEAFANFQMETERELKEELG